MIPSGETPSSIFELVDAALSRTTSDVLGLWVAVPLSVAETVAFDTASLTNPSPAVWRANFPADMGKAQTQLSEGELVLQISQKNLAITANRINEFVQSPMAGLSFEAFLARKPLNQPETELLLLLREIRDNKPVTFTPGENFTSRLGRTAQQFQAFLNKLQQSVLYYTWIETRVQEQLLGRTTIAWTGELDTIWQADLDPEQVILHQRTLSLALSSRTTLLQSFVMATQFAAKLAVLLSTPGGSILALPAAWKFINSSITPTSSSRN
jgi:hypothetical protein